MTNDPLNQFTKQVTQLIQNNTPQSLPPLMGIITKAESQYYCDINIEGMGTYTNVPCHGIPVKGDTAVIHFVEGKEEQRYADCARRLAVTKTELNTLFPENNECYNYLKNGDFRKASNDHTGNYQIITNESYTNATNNSCFLETTNNYIETIVNLKPCTSEYFKFQAYYKGDGTLLIECIDTKTQKHIPTMPTHNSHTKKTWTNPHGRWSWSYNKEVYKATRDDDTRIDEVLIRITNNTQKELTQMGEEIVALPHGMTIDALLVYDDNGSTNYYPHVTDVN